MLKKTSLKGKTLYTETPRSLKTLKIINAQKPQRNCTFMNLASGWFLFKKYLKNTFHYISEKGLHGILHFNRDTLLMASLKYNIFWKQTESF